MPHTCMQTYMHTYKHKFDIRDQYFIKKKFYFTTCKVPNEGEKNTNCGRRIMNRVRDETEKDTALSNT